VREKSRPFIGTRRFLPDVSSFLRDGTAAYGSREIECAIVAVVVALAYRYRFLTATAKSDLNAESRQPRNETLSWVKEKRSPRKRQR